MADFNGEIYNFKELRLELESLGHRFKSETDAEVIIYAYIEWGRECLSASTGCSLLPSGMRVMRACSSRAIVSASSALLCPHAGRVCVCLRDKSVAGHPGR